MGNKRVLRIAGLLVGLLLIVVPSVLAVEAEANSGAALYIGTASFEKGGAPCLACHGISGFGLAGGANYGPDLTGIFANFGEEGIAGILEDLTMFPSMAPIYVNRPLTEKEQADIAAFLAEVDGRPPLQIGARLAGHVAVGTAAVLGLVILVGWGRLNGVRQPLVDGARKGKGESR
jgi:mono/diheme cytochrome c family protein